MSKETSLIVDAVHEQLKQAFPKHSEQLHANRDWRICDYVTDLSVDELASAIASSANLTPKELTLKQIEEKLRLKIEQARLNGFTVTPMSGASIDFEAKTCCLGVAANDLNRYPEKLDWLSWSKKAALICGFENWGTSFDKDLHALGAKLRKECLAYIDKHSRQCRINFRVG